MFVQLTAPLGTLGLLDDHSLPAGTRVAFERTAVSGRGGPSLLISGDDRAATAAVIRESPDVSDVTRLDERDCETVYRLTWTEAGPALVDYVLETDGTVLATVAVDDNWSFDLRFPDRDAVARFYAHYDDATHPLTIRRVQPTGRAQQAPSDVLTVPQREALVRAVEAGYFEVPRKTSLNDLADELGISDTAVSQRLRRGLENILRGPPHEQRAVVHAGSRDD